MRLSTDLPKEYDREYSLNVKQQTIIIEMSFVNNFILTQIRTPMNTHISGGNLIIECFQKCLSACILTFIKAELLTEEFYLEHENILDEKLGIKEDITLSTMDISDLSYDLEYMINQYLTVLGHTELMSKKDELYGNEKYFTPIRK